jgi:hypothetical protein
MQDVCGRCHKNIKHFEYEKILFFTRKGIFLIEKETSVKYSQANIHINHLLRNLINFNKIHIINIGGIVEHHCLNFVLQLM